MELTNTQDVQMLIEDLKGLRIKSIPQGSCFSMDRHRVIPADTYDLRYIDKQDAKKLTRKEIDSLIEYGQGYIQEYEAGKYMFQDTGHRYEKANFDESEVYLIIKSAVQILKEEIKRRM